MSTPPGDAGDSEASPRPPLPADDAASTPTPTPPARRAPVPPSIFLEQAALANQQQQRASMSSLMFMTFFFFMMSGGSPPMGLDEIEQRRHDVDNFGDAVTQLQLYLNGSQSNYSFSPTPVPSVLTMLPPRLLRDHSQARISEPEDGMFSPHYFQNMTGFYREADAHYLNLTDPSSSNSSHHFFRHLQGDHQGSKKHPITSLVNQTSWNETEAVRKRGDFDWQGVSSWSLNINEKRIIARDVNGDIIVEGDEAKRRGSDESTESEGQWDDWSWIHVSSLTISNADKTGMLDYNLAGVHQRSTGEFTLLGMPSGQGIDIRKLPSLLPDRRSRNITGRMVLFEMQRHLARLRADPSLGGGSDSNRAEAEYPSPDPICPLQLHLRLLPVPFPYSAAMLREYEREQREPTGIWVKSPPHGIQVEGVAIFEECGVAYGLSGGHGTAADTFWHKSIHYAIYASIANIVILFLFVWEMEATRTPSGLAKISFWSIVLMVGADAWLFSAHAVVAIMSDNITTLPLLLPSFLCLCTALVFGPRFTVMLHRVQAPESPTTPARIAASTPAGTAATDGSQATAGEGTLATGPTRFGSLQAEINRHPHLQWLLLMVFCIFLMFVGVLPQVVPLLLGILYSFWLPQIWRNARRGNRKSLSWRFVLGMSIARQALPLYAFGCPDNVFFVDTNSSIWMLPVYVWAQVLILWAQERFGASFFLPKRFAPPPPYDYHQPLPNGDSESGRQDFGDCSICMEPILVNHVSAPYGSGDKHSLDDKSALAATATNMGVVGSRVMNINFRRTYALAPCHHLFHTDCLNQWMAIKNTCPLCKRGLPPL